MYTDEQLTFCEEIPKLELHAHLNGSIRDETIRELAIEASVDPNLLKLTSKGDRTLAECFKLFDIIHKCTTSCEVISRISREVAEDFAADNVIYLELRTTPKNRPEYGITKRSYVEAVLEGFAQYQAKAESDGLAMMVRLLLSVDRREDGEAALQTVKLAAELKGQGVVGIDLSGNPTVGSWDLWEPALREARRLGLKLTIHAAEVYNPGETAMILNLRADRLGHMCYLDEVLEAELKASKTPLELCLSSNVITESVTGFPDHHFLPLFTAGHPVVLCTDDSGVFSTSLSKEYAIAAAAFGLDQVALLTLAEAAIDYCFVPAEDKETLRSRFEGYRLKHPRIGSQKLRRISLTDAVAAVEASP